MSECHTLFPDSKLDETMGGLLEGPIGPGPRDIIYGNCGRPMSIMGRRGRVAKTPLRRRKKKILTLIARVKRSHRFNDSTSVLFLPCFLAPCHHLEVAAWHGLFLSETLCSTQARLNNCAGVPRHAISLSETSTKQREHIEAGNLHLYIGFASAADTESVHLVDGALDSDRSLVKICAMDLASFLEHWSIARLFELPAQLLESQCLGST